MRRPRRQGEGLTASCGRRCVARKPSTTIGWRARAYPSWRTWQNLDEEEKASIVRLEAANLDATQAWQIRQNLQDLSAYAQRGEREEVSPTAGTLGQPSVTRRR